jgi:hypothetical protein
MRRRRRRSSQCRFDHRSASLRKVRRSETEGRPDRRFARRARHSMQRSVRAHPSTGRTEESGRK